MSNCNEQDILNFKLPRYSQIPNIDLYMDQLVVYIEATLTPIWADKSEKVLTTAMVNNYVKQGIVPPTIKKRYSREHVAYLIVICLLKQIFSIQELGKLIAVQNSSFDIEISYNYMCTELENALHSTFTNKKISDDTASTNADERLLVRNSAIAFAHKLYTQKLMDSMYANLNLPCSK